MELLENNNKHKGTRTETKIINFIKTDLSYLQSMLQLQTIHTAYLRTNLGPLEGFKESNSGLRTGMREIILGLLLGSTSEF